MARPRRTISHSNRASSPGEQDLSALSSEVLKLRLQALNFPITGSKGQLLNRLKRALPGKVATSTTAQPKRVSKAKAKRGALQREQPRWPGARRKTFQRTSTTLITKTTPCQTVLRCPLSIKWSSRILSRTSPVSKRTLASANLSVQPSKLSWPIQSAPQ